MAGGDNITVAKRVINEVVSVLQVIMLKE